MNALRRIDAIRRTLLFTTLTIAWCGHAALAAPLLVFTTGALTDAATKGVSILVARSKDQDGLRLELLERRVEPQEFCAGLKQTTAGIYVALMSAYQRCFPEQPLLKALDFPFLARDWIEARKLLNGPLGAAVAEGLEAERLSLLAFWDGDIRIISSQRTIAAAADLKGKTLFRPSTFASATMAAASGASEIPTGTADIFAALATGTAEAADLPLAFYNQNKLSDIHKSVLITNHALDPFVVAAPTSTISNFESAQRGRLESFMRQVALYERAEADSSREAILRNLQTQNVRVTYLTDDARASFKSGGLTQASIRNAEFLFAKASPTISSAALAQIQGQASELCATVSFVTNRSKSSDEFNSTVGSYLLYGTASVGLDYDGDYSLADRASKWFAFRKDCKGVAIKWAAVSRKPFPTSFIEVPPAMPAKAPLLYIHGFANTFDDAVQRAAWLSWNAQRPVVAFLWPSVGRPTPADYRTDQKTADASITQLAELLGTFGRAYDRYTDLDIVLHSMGARVTLAALEELARTNQGKKEPKFRRLVLVAPDVSSTTLRHAWRRVRSLFEKPATLYASNHDLALGISQALMNRDEGPRAGLAPPVLEADGVESIFIGPNDFSFQGHSYHIANGVIADDILEAIRWGANAPDRRGTVHPHDGDKYYELHRIKAP